METIDYKQSYFFSGNETGCLLIHGFTSTPAELRELGELLHKVGYTVLGVRLSGHGTTVEDLEKSNYKDWVQSAQEGYDYLKKTCSQIHVIGHSMGGVLALYIAENNAVHKVVALAPALVTKDRAAKYVGVAKYFMKYTEWTSEVRPEEESKYLLGYSKIPLSSIHELNRLQKTTKKSLHKVDQPLLIIHSIQDNTVHEKSIPIIEQGVASKEIKKVSLSNCGHNITIEREKKTVFAEVLQFLE